MCDILREEKQIKAGTTTEGRIKKERKKVLRENRTAILTHISPACLEAIAIPQINCFSLILNFQTLKRRQEILSSYPFLIVLLTRHGRELFQTTLAGNLISFREGLSLFSSGRFSPYPLLFFRVTTLFSRSFVFLCLTCVICQVMWKSEVNTYSLDIPACCG